MTPCQLTDTPHTTPAAGDTDRAERGRERWLDQAETTGDPALAAFIRESVAADHPCRPLLDALFGNSPFLTKCALQEPAWIHVLCETGVDAAFDRALDTVRTDAAATDDQTAVMRALRVAKRRVALTTAVADILGLWTLEQVTGALSRLAETTLDLACGHLLARLHTKGDLVLPHPEAPTRDSGLIVLGMGKLGARELNYSSDIDLIVLFDEERLNYRGRRTPREDMVRLTKDVVRLMEERTAHGYVFRCDLRLRPDPGSTSVAISTLAAEIYYESFGQNWERAAMIKARPVAGDIPAGDRFLDGLRPFVWRRSLDFNAIQDIHSIKRQIHAQKGHAVVAVEGHNLKLGRGGIREIEFFVQTQQLIWGGRDPTLRDRETLKALNALTARGLVAPAVRDDLTAAYRHLRQAEHRLQMVNDEQTQTLPTDTDALRALAVFLGYEGIKPFALALKSTLMTVQDHYADLFEDQPNLSGGAGNLVFTGGEDDPETLRTLSDLGFANPTGIASTIRGWHTARYRAMSSTRTRERLTELMPTLIRALARTVNPDAALLRFDSFLAHLPTGAQIMSLFLANPHVMTLVAEIMGDAPRLAEHLARNPRLLDAVLEPAFLNTAPTQAVLREGLDVALRDARVFEDVLDICRRWTNDHRFQIGVQALFGRQAPGATGHALADVADVALAVMLDRVWCEFAQTHGAMPDAAVVVVALGKLGGQEMTPTSDLDLIMVYDVPDSVEQSTGPKPLPPTAYYTRLVQRFINAITANTAQGRLYEVDMRLRPSGNKGPLATSLESFRRYQGEAAWTWEHQALTRARVVAGPATVAERVATVIRDTVCRPRDPERLAHDVADMRRRMDAEHGDRNRWNIKHRRGGLVDVEFLAQFLQLQHAHDHPNIMVPNTAEGLRRVGDAGLLPAPDAAFLSDAHQRWLSLQGMIRHSMDGVPTDDTLPEGLKARLIAIWDGAVDFEDLKARMDDTAARVMEVYDRLLGAATAPGGDEAPR
ncbi:bifunctional [glutamine synthetase] adenylyltransferase/[glutamine synthetase]-adenylyl-L-tyrosine phosphorylase [Roseospira marina]|uniref:Bifunctional glutamine synthetase adenylyltransferase/adenylyl-removing enzyme n=1 Tax=Roseospira marina TaxID=140057 RepID=A0A5M6I9F1_9PROT|nr:bifunctional [glutamine synthetase] adenylyltransferase/[glutamine synthetase]-adenylyl-L-tyrosine phosphorylase [Roseospira marina]KAA5604802.1 bifunctional [glutamine synthetase] adenylyltransferase/[glutamine synthetase]-adenylyl-L-tyrosine phosphorylase [Roseospira marina]MBB4313493.1 glutamate-ammonia-ligase adenylyltransferase [Roseospira marina]MBB5086655.1 glutamate-ammonia-ligase adenylyltransferase [Roseospira marina]